MPTPARRPRRTERQKLRPVKGQSRWNSIAELASQYVADAGEPAASGLVPLGRQSADAGDEAIDRTDQTIDTMRIETVSARRLASSTFARAEAIAMCMSGTGKD